MNGAGERPQRELIRLPPSTVLRIPRKFTLCRCRISFQALGEFPNAAARSDKIATA
jgi:hypothetical protein